MWNEDRVDKPASGRVAPRSPSLHQLMIEAFQKGPNDAGILQGVREFRSGLPHVRVVLEPSPKNGGFLPCEGRLEAALVEALEIDPDALAVRMQPFAFTGPKGRKLVCDCAVKWVDHTYTIVDVKPEGQLDRPSAKERMSFVRTAMSEEQVPHRVITEVELEREPARSIRQALRKGAAVRLPPGGRETLIEMLGNRRMRLSDFRREVIDAGFPTFSPEKLALLGETTFPLNAPLRETTLIGASHGTDSSLTDGWGTVRDIRLPL